MTDRLKTVYTPINYLCGGIIIYIVVVVVIGPLARVSLRYADFSVVVGTIATPSKISQVFFKACMSAS